MDFNIREFLDTLIKAPTLFVYSVFKWSQKIDPHKMFITCIMQEVLIILFFIVYATTPGFNSLGIVVFVFSILLSLAINYVFVLGMPSDKDYWRYIITGAITDDLYRRATKSKAMSSKLGIEYTRGKKKKVVIQEEPVEEQRYEEEYQEDVITKNNYDDNIDSGVVESAEEIAARINITDVEEDSVEEKECSIHDQLFNNESCEEHEYHEEDSDEDEDVLEVKQNTQVSEEVTNNVQEEVTNNVQEEVVAKPAVNSEYAVEEDSIKDFSENIEQKLMDNISRTSKLAGIVDDIPNISVDGYDNDLVEDDYEV